MKGKPTVGSTFFGAFSGRVPKATKDVNARLFTRSVNKVMRLIQYNSVLTFKLQIEFVPFKIVPLGGYTPPETLFPLFVATLVVANRNRF